MPRLTKDELLGEVLRALASGWTVDRVGGTHPYRILASAPQGQEAILLHVWNITHGGATRDPEEYRIQITGVSKLTFRDGLKTILLGVAQIGADRVLVAFDPHKHATFGSSPSIQVHKPTLDQALAAGMKAEEKRLARGKSEIVVAFRPEFITQYLIQMYPAYHGATTTTTAAEGQSVAALDFTKAEFSDADLASVPTERRRALSQVVGWVRDRAFRRKVLQIYDHKCAICGIQAGLVQGSHIIAVSRAGLDDVRNGVGLCVIHHAAYDKGLIAIDEDYAIRYNRRMADDLRASGFGLGLDEFLARARVGERIYLPRDERFHPSRANLAENLQAKGKSNFV